MVPVAQTTDLDLRETRLTAVELLQFFPEGDKTTFAFEHQEEIVVGVILGRRLFVYGKDWGDRKGFKFRFLGQWLNSEGRPLGDFFAFLNPSPHMNPRLQLVWRGRDNTVPMPMTKMSKKGGFGFISYDLAPQMPDEARYLKVRVLKELAEQDPTMEILVSKSHFIMELPAIP